MFLPRRIVHLLNVLYAVQFTHQKNISKRNVKSSVRQEHVCRRSACCGCIALLCPLKSGMCGLVAGLRTPRMQSCVGSCSAPTPGHYRTPAGSRSLSDRQEVFEFPSVRPGQRSGWEKQSQVCEREPCQCFMRMSCKQRIFTT